MLHPIMTDAKVPTAIGNAVDAWILVIGGITILYYVIWLLICRVPRLQTVSKPFLTVTAIDEPQIFRHR